MAEEPVAHQEEQQYDLAEPTLARREPPPEPEETYEALDEPGEFLPSKQETPRKFSLAKK